MEGHWTGTGTSKYLYSGKTESFTVEVHSVVESNQLNSTNDVTSADGKTYSRVYLVLAKAPGQYVFNYVGVAHAPTSTGVFDGSVLKFEQVLGPDYTIHSETRFPSPDRSVYTEVLWHDQNQLTQTEIQYTRIP